MLGMGSEETNTDAMAESAARAAAAERSHVRMHAVESLKKVEPSDRSEGIFLGSFITAAALGIANAVNMIRHGFYESFVKPSGGIVPEFDRKLFNRSIKPAIMKMDDVNEMLVATKKGINWERAKQHPFGDLFQQRQMIYEALAEKFGAPQADVAGAPVFSRFSSEAGDKYRTLKIETTKTVGRHIDERLRSGMGIESHGLKGWTSHMFKQRQHTGDFTRRGAVFAATQTTVVMLGAIATLKYSKHLLDLIGAQDEKNDIAR